MTTTTKTFNFVADTEDWSATTGGNVIAAWYPPHRAKIDTVHQTNPPLSTLGGSLRMTQPSYGQSAADSYWEYHDDWETLGVPSGHLVTSVTAIYQYRWICYKANSNQSAIEFGATDAGVGPFELRDDGGSLVGTFSAIQYAPARTSGDRWKRYPLDPTSYDNWWITEYPISETPVTWKGVTSSSVAVASSPSNTVVRFRLKNLMPANAASQFQWIRLKIDRIQIVVESSAPVNQTLTLVFGF